MHGLQRPPHLSPTSAHHHLLHYCDRGAQQYPATVFNICVIYLIAPPRCITERRWCRCDFIHLQRSERKAVKRNQRGGDPCTEGTCAECFPLSWGLVRVRGLDLVYVYTNAVCVWIAMCVRGRAAELDGLFVVKAAPKEDTERKRNPPSPHSPPPTQTPLKSRADETLL